MRNRRIFILKGVNENDETLFKVVAEMGSLDADTVSSVELLSTSSRQTAEKFLQYFSGISAEVLNGIALRALSILHSVSEKSRKIASASDCQGTQNYATKSHMRAWAAAISRQTDGLLDEVSKAITLSNKVGEETLIILAALENALTTNEKNSLGRCEEFVPWDSFVAEFEKIDFAFTRLNEDDEATRYRKLIEQNEMLTRKAASLLSIGLISRNGDKIGLTTKAKELRAKSANHCSYWGEE